MEMIILYLPNPKDFVLHVHCVRCNSPVDIPIFHWPSLLPNSSEYVLKSLKSLLRVDISAVIWLSGHPECYFVECGQLKLGEPVNRPLGHIIQLPFFSPDKFPFATSCHEMITIAWKRGHLPRESSLHYKALSAFVKYLPSCVF